MRADADSSSRQSTLPPSEAAATRGLEIAQRIQLQHNDCLEALRHLRM